MSHRVRLPRRQHPRRRRTGPAALPLLTAAVLVLATAVLVATPAEAAKRRPDLVVQALGNPPATVETGDTFAVTSRVRNAGTARARRSTTSYLLSRDDKAGGDTTVGTQPLPALGPRRSATRTTRLTVPERTAPGTYRLLACADSRRAVRERSETNNCRVAARAVTVTDPFEGRLTGTLSFVDEGVVNGQTSSTWSHTASAVVAMDVEGAAVFEEVFESTNSTYQLGGIRTDVSGDDVCRTTTTRTRTGSGSFAWSTDPFDTEIAGSFVRADRGRVRLALEMGYLHTTDTVRRGTQPSCPWQTTSTAPAVDITSILLEERSRTARSITYGVKSWVAEMGTPSDWDTVTGTLTLQVR